jgi:methionine-gamma-lyase
MGFGEHGGVNMSSDASTTLRGLNADTMPEIFQGQRGSELARCFLYGRHLNPTVYALGKHVAPIDDAESGSCTLSVMATISSTLLQRYRRR